jgi:two-component sensor histidine kinase
LIERIHALARAHDLLTEGAWQGASLADVIGRTLAGVAPARARLSGPKVRLGPNAAVTLNMAFHELATNALKYGALSKPEGRVEVSWDLDGEGVVAIAWRECGGPPVTAPVARGFGSRLIEQALPREMGGEAVMDFEPSGLRCRMRLPLSAKLSVAT